MKVTDITDKPKVEDVITDLQKGKVAPSANVEASNKAIDINKHDVANPSIRKDKRVKMNPEEVDGYDDVTKVSNSEGDDIQFKTVKVARVKLAIQKLIIKRAVAFLFGVPVKYLFDAEGDNEQHAAIEKAFNKILKSVKGKAHDRQLARTLFTYGEAAEVWFPVKLKEGKKHKKYGFEASSKIKSAIWSPATNELYPYFDATGDMVAFSRSYSAPAADGNNRNFFETYTDEEHCLWVNDKEGWKMVDGYPLANPIGKIPVIYLNQGHRETEDVDNLIDRLETLLSNFADTNDYHAAPKIVLKGEVESFSQKGDSGGLIEMDKEGSAEYLSWASAPEAVKLEIQTLLQMIYTITQTPDISFETVKGIGSVTGVALKLMFMDAHLKVQDHCEVIDEALLRRSSVLLAFIGKLDNNLEKAVEEVDVEPVVTPFMLTNDVDEVNKWVAANGGKPIVSQKQSVINAKLSEDPDEDYKQLEVEQAAESYVSIHEPTY